MADAITSNFQTVLNNLSTINRNIGILNDNIGTIDTNLGVVDDHVKNVDGNVKIVYDEISKLAKDFSDFVKIQLAANAKSNSQQRLIQIRQEMEKRFGHYDIVRRTTTGILQADDLGIVRKETISNATEELMLSTPGYWLAPCLVALAAWISDRPELAEVAIREAIKRDDEKTSLFWALVCRRADRKQASLKWTQRYLASQDEENLNRTTVVILDAFASGLLGADTEGVISKQMSEWLEHLADKDGFVEKQTSQWSEAINMKRSYYQGNNYTYLKQYSKTWDALRDVMEGAELHAKILDYFTNIFNREAETDTLKAQLDEILDTLVTEYDEEEAPLRKEELYHQLVVDYDGDEDRAKKYLAVKQTALEQHKDFTQLLTDAAMNPEQSHSSISTQKFAIALSKEWISNAYDDVVAKNRMNVPGEIEINVDTYNGKTADGKDEGRILGEFHDLVQSERKSALSLYDLSGFEKFCLYGGAIISVLGLVMIMMKMSALLGAIAIIGGIAMVIYHFSKKSSVEKERERINRSFDEKRAKGYEIIRALLAEIVDFRQEFELKDAESKKVIDFLEDISPEQYVKKLGDSTRRIDVSK